MCIGNSALLEQADLPMYTILMSATLNDKAKNGI